jgi:hypothetical protein
MQNDREEAQPNFGACMRRQPTFEGLSGCSRSQAETPPEPPQSAPAVSHLAEPSTSPLCRDGPIIKWEQSLSSF